MAGIIARGTHCSRGELAGNTCHEPRSLAPAALHSHNRRNTFTSEALRPVRFVVCESKTVRRRSTQDSRSIARISDYLVLATVKDVMYEGYIERAIRPKVAPRGYRAERSNANPSRYVIGLRHKVTPSNTSLRGDDEATIASAQGFLFLFPLVCTE